MTNIDPSILIKQSIFGLMPLFSITILGISLTMLKIFDKKTIDGIALGYKNVFNPCFVFFNTVGVISTFNISTLLPLILSPFFMILTGLAINWLHSLIFKPPENYSRVVKCVIAFSNTANLPVVLLRGICSPYGPLMGNDYCDHANSYIAIQFLTYTVIGWSYGWTMVSIDKIASIYIDKANSDALLIDNQIVRKKSIFKMIIENLALPGPVSCFVAVVIGMIPGINQTFYDKTSGLFSVVDVGVNLGIAGIVFGQATLGSNLILLKSEKTNVLSYKYIGSVILFKNLLMPLVSLGIIYLGWNLGIFGDNIVS